MKVKAVKKKKKKKKFEAGRHRPSVHFEPMPDQATRRDCQDCLDCLDDVKNSQVVRVNRAEFYGYAADLRGGIDRSSRRPVCVGHAYK
jgi:hypothetical protein